MFHRAWGGTCTPCLHSENYIKLIITLADIYDKKNLSQIEDVGDHAPMMKKNPTYGIQSISQPMLIVAPMPKEGGRRKPKNPIF